MNVAVREQVRSLVGVPGSLGVLVERFVPVMEDVAEFYPEVRVYAWEPRTLQLPALWLWMSESPAEQRDQITKRDSVGLLVRLAVTPTDSNDEMTKLIDYCDATRYVLDNEFRPNRLPLAQGMSHAASFVTRTSMRPFIGEFGGKSCVGFEFPFTFDLDRRIVP